MLKISHRLDIHENDLSNVSAEGASVKKNNSHEDNLKHVKLFFDELYIYNKITNEQEKVGRAPRD